jgi:peptidoglycan L-alanyl-D-glutamate endopeptidase CwlK
MIFGGKSSRKLYTCHKDIQKVLNLAILRTKIDFGISEGFRDINTQQAYYAIGRTTQLHRETITNVDGIVKKGKHNYFPAQAVDIYVYHPDKATRKKISYDGLHLSYIAGLIDSCAQELYNKGEITHKIRWGGNWDSDGIIKFDQSLNDQPHFEMIKP